MEQGQLGALEEERIKEVSHKRNLFRFKSLNRAVETKGPEETSHLFDFLNAAISVYRDNKMVHQRLPSVYLRAVSNPNQGHAARRSKRIRYQSVLERGRRNVSNASRGNDVANARKQYLTFIKQRHCTNSERFILVPTLQCYR